LSSDHQFISDCQKKVIAGIKLTQEELTGLINTSQQELRTLSDSANKITRTFQGNKVDVEQLANIKKNYCSEDCAFCGQSSFFNTGVDSYQLLPAEQIVPGDNHLILILKRFAISLPR
jgi:biotin synthase